MKVGLIAGGLAAVAFLGACLASARAGGSEVAITSPTAAPSRDVAWGDRFPSRRPESARAVLGTASPFDVGHCGLSHIVDFDGSFWDVDPATMTNAENSQFGINADRGTMTLVAADRAVYKSWTGGEAILHRHIGEKRFSGCM